MRFLVVTVLAYFLTGCLTPSPPTSAKYRQITVAGTKAVYVELTCRPNIKWQGFDITLEGIEYPNNPGHPLMFQVGKINYTEKELSAIRSTVFYYDGLLSSTCQNMVMIPENRREDYAKHRDTTLERLANYLAALEKTSKNEEVIELSKNAKASAGSPASQ